MVHEWRTRAGFRDRGSPGHRSTARGEIAVRPNQDRGGLGHANLMEARRQVMRLVIKDPRLVRVGPNGLDDLPEYRTDVDWERLAH